MLSNTGLSSNKQQVWQDDINLPIHKGTLMEDEDEVTNVVSLNITLTNDVNENLRDQWLWIGIPVSEKKKIDHKHKDSKGNTKRERASVTEERA